MSSDHKDKGKNDDKPPKNPGHGHDRPDCPPAPPKRPVG